MTSITNVTIKVSNAKEIAERMSAIAVLAAKIGALCEDVAKEMRILASMGDGDAERTEDGPAAQASTVDAATESLA